MACKYYINGKEYTENSIKEYIGENHIDINDIRLTTIEDLANILAYSNSKLILPGYEVEYTTPDNMKFKTYAEASNHISELAKSIEDVDLGYIKETYFKEKEEAYLKFKKEFEENQREAKKAGLPVTIGSMKFSTEHGFIQDIKGFIEKNKQFEQSKEIIETWKKENNIIYNPEEVYSRGQGFYSSIGAYSSLELDLLLQNLLQHIEDNKKAGGEFTISAFTKPIDKRLKHIEGTGNRVRFVIYPKSEDIKWAAPTDVYSGSVWDANTKISTDKKSELLGVSYTKSPSLNNVNKISPNLSEIIDSLEHAHNELAIELTMDNFEIEFDEDIDYSTKQLINSVNKIIQQKRLQSIENKINQLEKQCN
ncbi:MAG: hypothetical protein E6R13_05110 [Spirochaetes bacterium]|nr:MAG: hypothetical protein E6R13_05110 [Spirochaetota bacterium]